MFKAIFFPFCYKNDIFKVSKPGHKQRAVIPHFYSVEKSIEKKKLTIDGEK